MPDTPQPIDLGSTRVNNAVTSHLTTKDFVIKNTGSGGGDLMVTSITFTNSDYRLFPAPTFPIRLATNETQTITVEFNPSAIGTRAASMTLNNNDANKTIDLTGVGTAALISVPGTVDFGIVNNGATLSQDLSVANSTTTSQGPLTVTSAAITGSTFFSFGSTLGCSGGTTCTFSPPLVITSATTQVPVICQPPATASGQSMGTVTFTSDSDAGGASTTTVTCTAGRPNILVSASSLNYTGVAVGGTPQSKTVTITNNGNTALNYSVAETPNVSQFAITAGCTSGCTIPPPPAANTATFTLTFTPDSPAGVTTRIDISNNDPDPGDNVKKIDITGTGDQGVVATDPATPLAFGGVPQGTTKTVMFTLTNSGNVTITGISAMLGSTTQGFQFNTATLPASLTPGQQVTLNATFTPPAGNANFSTSLTFQASWTADTHTDTTTTVLSLTGTGQTTGYDVTPTSRSFGEFRVDTRPTVTYQIQNTAQADVTVLSAIDFVPDAGTMANELAFAVTKGGTPIALSPPPVLHMGEQLDVTVTAQLARTGQVSGHVNIRTNFAPDRQVALTGTATSAAFSAPSTVDFGAVDIDGGPQMQTFKLTNMGAAPLDITSIVKMPGGSPAFAVALPTATATVMPGTDFTLTVTYTPTAARPANQFDTLVLDATLVGITSAPFHATITIRGRGIDRVFAVGNVPTFSSFRNPGDTAPVQPVTVRNDGEALLKITGVMVDDGAGATGTPVWQLVDTGTVDVPGNSSHDFMVKFVPKDVDDATHATPRGHLVLMNNDNARPMATIDLSGTCVARKVAFDETMIDLGQIGVGIPAEVTLPVVRNMEGVAFTIRSVELADQTVFRLDDGLSNVALPASSTQTLSVTLDPAAPGQLTTTVRLFVDQDPTPQAELTVRATAVFVEAHGGGGCAVAGGSAGGGAALAFAVLAFGGLGRRRRRALARGSVAMTSGVRSRGSVATTSGVCARGGVATAGGTLARSGAIAAWAAVAMVAMVAMAGPARAEDIGIAVFEPTPSTTGSGFQLQSADVGANGSWAASSVVSYASNPLVLAAEGYRAAPVERSTLLDVGLAYALLGRFEIGAHLPLYMQSGQVDASVRGVEAANGTALGKLKVHGKAQLWRGGGGLGDLVVGASAIAVLPTASARQYTGSDKPEGELLLLGAFTPAALGSRLSLSLNGGAVVRGESRFANIAQKSGIAWGAGASYRVAESLRATAELFGEARPSGGRADSSMAGPMSSATSDAMLVQAEWLAGVSWRADRRFTVGVAAGRGLTDALGTPDVRGVVSIAFTQGALALAPVHSGIAQLRPDVDSDGDGIPDSVDKCPLEPEDKDLFDDDDGCPDLDNDHDGILDAQDKCPLDPEDKDGFEDVDGCPDKDNDGDGIPDAQDKCPNEPEDKDGFEDLDGCPDPDNDHDGIPDAQDKCPNEPETINGIKDDDGCPDKGDSTIVLSPDRIETLDPIVFNGLKLGRTALPLLGQVAATLRAHTEIIRVRVTVHVQPSGDADADQAKSEKRAQAVRDWLVQWGIAPGRLDARGFGGAKPLVSPDQRGAAKINDRIEFIILERK